MTREDAEILAGRIERWRMWGTDRTGEALVAGLMQLERPAVQDLARSELLLATLNGEPTFVLEG